MLQSDHTGERTWEHEHETVAREQAVVAKLGLHALSGADLSTLMNEAVTLVAQTLDNPIGMVLELLPDGKALLLRAGVGWRPDLVGQALIDAGGDPDTGAALLAHEPLIIEDLSADTSVPRCELLASHSVISGMSVAIRGQERPFGVLGTYTTQPRRFTKDDVNFLQGVANVLAMAIERKRTEDQLREQTETLETVNRIGRLLSSELDLERLVQSVTDAATKLTGAQFGAFFYNVANERGQSYMLYTLSGAPREAFAQFPMPRNTAVFGPTFQGDGVIRLDDVRQDPRYGQNPPYTGMPPGHLPVVSYLAAPVVSRSGEVLGGLFFGHPQPAVFTERAERIVVGLAAQAAIAMDNARLYQEAQSQRLRLLTVVEQIPEGVVIADAQSGALSWNSAGRRIGGPVSENLEQWRSQTFRRSDGQPYAYGDLPLVRALHGETVLGVEMEFSRPERRSVTLLLNAAPITGDGGQIIAAVAVFQDITQRKTLEQLKDEFMSLAAHELKTPITAIKGHSQLLLRRALRQETSLGERETQLLQTIDERSTYMAGLVNELLDLSRIETGGFLLHPQPTDLAALVREAAVQQRTLSPDHPVILRGTDQPLVGSWDRGRIEQVVTNLLDNAAKYSPPGQPITVSVARGPEPCMVRLEVQDHGIGIPPDEAPHLFERHFRGSNVARSSSGLGLGLYLSAKIIHLHGGRIWADSVVRQGSTFHVTLPLEIPAP